MVYDKYLDFGAQEMVGGWVMGSMPTATAFRGKRL